MKCKHCECDLESGVSHVQNRNGKCVTAVTAGNRSRSDVVRAETLEAIYDKANGVLVVEDERAIAMDVRAGMIVKSDETVTAAWSDASRKAAAEARKNHGELRHWEKHEGFMKDLHNLTNEKTAEMSAERHPGEEFHKTKFSDHAYEGSYSHAQHISDTVHELSEKHKIDLDNDDDQMDGPAAHVLESVRKNLKVKSSESNSRSATITAAGTSEGAKKGWEHRSKMAGEATKIAMNAASYAQNSSNSWAHKFAADAFNHAARAHMDASDAIDEHQNAHGYDKAASAKGVEHRGRHFAHLDYAKKLSQRAAELESAKASDSISTDVIHCRSHFSAAGSILAADKQWNPGEPVEFMWMPSGTHTICAGFRNGSIELTVNCDQNTAANVQASLDAWRVERPKQEPFGCVEHREHEASVRVSAQQAFSFKNDGVYIAAEPTVLGAQNVNGKVHRSWSPSFTTDADYSQAKTVKTASGATVMVFPEGVRGSRSNPAEITGVDFCVGTLTNKPAFHAMSPVKGSEAEDTVQATWSDAARKAAAESRKQHYSSRYTDAENNADEHSRNAIYDSENAADGGKLRHHVRASKSHTSAAISHEIASHLANQAGEDLLAKGHDKRAQDHWEAAAQHMAAKHGDVLPKFQASDASDSASVRAHCAHILLQDVPDATPAEIACYEKCLDEGGSHSNAVAEIKAQRKPEHVTQPAKASEPVTPETIAARQQAALEASAQIAADHGVARTALDDVYDKVTAGGTSESVKKAWVTRKAKVGDRVKINEGSGLDSGKEGTVVHHSEVKTDGRGIPTNVSGAYKPIDHSKEHVIKTDDGKLVAMFHNRVSVQSDQAKASSATSSDTVQATWSDAAREAARNSKSAKAAGFHQKQAEVFSSGSVSKLAHESSARAFRTGDKAEHKAAVELHDKAATAARNLGSDGLADQHVEHIGTHRTHAGLVNKASEPLTLESIYARAGANR